MLGPEPPWPDFRWIIGHRLCLLCELAIAIAIMITSIIAIIMSMMMLIIDIIVTTVSLMPLL